MNKSRKSSSSLSDVSPNTMYSCRDESVSSNTSDSVRTHTSPVSPSLRSVLPSSKQAAAAAATAGVTSRKSRSSHNKIEKKYRTNINTKFIELKDAVPTLRVLDNVTDINFDQLEGLAPASRLNKANILSKATEYIKHLELKNDLLLNEVRTLRANPNYSYQPPNSLHNVPIEVISNLPNQPQMSRIVLPSEFNNGSSNGSSMVDNNHMSSAYPADNAGVLSDSYRHEQSHTLSNRLPNRAAASSLHHQTSKQPILGSYPSQDTTHYIQSYNHVNEQSQAMCSSVYHEGSIDCRNCYGYRSSMNNIKSEVLDSPSHTQQAAIQNHPPTEFTSAYTTQQPGLSVGNNSLQMQDMREHYYSQDGYNNSSSNHSNNNSNNSNIANNNMRHNNHLQEPFYEAPNARLARKIMIAGVTTLVGSNIVGSGASGGPAYGNAGGPDYHSMSASPIFFLLTQSIKLIQLVTFFSCVYFFVQPVVSGFINWKKDNAKKSDKYRSFYLLTFVGIIRFFLPGMSSSTSQFVSPTATNQAPEVFPIDLTSFPTSFCGLLFAYIKILNVSDCSNLEALKTKHPNLANPIEHTFNKLILLDLILRRSPFIGYLLGFKSRIEFLVNSLLRISQSGKTRDIHSRITDFIHCDPGFINSRSVVDQLARILASLHQTKSSALTAKQLYGNDSDNSGRGYNAVYEYLVNTPTNKLNLFELVAVLWCVDNVRARMVKFLGDVVNEGAKVDETIEGDIKKLIADIRKIETFVPTPCIKLIKCCKIFKSLLDPENESYLNDALIMILLSVEENLLLIKQNNDSNKAISEKLLAELHSPIPVLRKVLIVIHAAQISALSHTKNAASSSAAAAASSSSSNTASKFSQPIQLLSDENRLSLLCSIILHQYAIGNVDYGRSLIRFLKGERTRKFMCSDSVSLMASIATFRTIVVVLDNEKRNEGIANEDSEEEENGVKEENFEESNLEGEDEHIDDDNIVDDDLDDDHDDHDDDDELDFGHLSSDVEMLLTSTVSKRNGLETTIESDTDSEYDEGNNSLVCYSEGQSLNSNDHRILEDLLCGLRLYVGQGKTASAGDSTDYDILSLHYGLQSELSHRLLELAKELVGYTE